MNTNIGSFERVIRPIVAIGIITMVMVLAQIPPWLALLATYPFFTALLSWDPIYALINTVLRKQQRQVLHHNTPQGVSA